MKVTVEINGSVKATLPLSPGGTGTDIWRRPDPAEVRPGFVPDLVQGRDGQARLLGERHDPALRPNGVAPALVPRFEALEHDIVPRR